MSAPVNERRTPCTGNRWAKGRDTRDRNAKDVEPDEGDGAQLGLRCPVYWCCDVRVTHTRPLPNGTIGRYRYSRNCGKHIVTTERVNPS